MNLEIRWKNAECDDSGRPRFVPGDTIEGRVSWLANHAVDGLEVALLFESKGKATPQQEIFETTTFANTAQRGDCPFSFTAPAWPWSFSGKLISVVWIVRAYVADPVVEMEWPLVISPSRSEIDLYAYPVEGKSLGKGWRRSQQFGVSRRKRK